MRRSRWWMSAGALAFVTALVAIFVLAGPESQPGRPLEPPGPPGTGPLTLVTLGDSTLSGEGAGLYTPDTNGLNGNWCHRSPNATVYETEVPGIEAKMNFACSGAPSAQVGFGDTKQWTETSQAQRLGELTTTHRVAAVVIAVGANDEPHFSQLISECFHSWFDIRAAPCSERLKTEWQPRIDAMVPRVVTAVADVKKALADRGYDPEDYDLVLQSYAAPIGPGIPEEFRNLNGCPFRTEDLDWVAGPGITQLTEGLRTAATQTGARFLDLSRAGAGHEACSGGPNAAHEWFSRLTVQWTDLSSVDRANHAIQESFHPNAAGHAQFGRCLSEFLSGEAPAAACLKGEDGNLHATISP
ncbi:GDSL-type esterase/lipase family protein [Saccharothrix sp. AJ9571]|nr:GDSL-type esterase/lipase family protein [Saccharothrix sp. AJ9571]